MRALNTLTWINRRGAPLAVLAILFGVCALAHNIALGVVKMAEGLSGADARSEARLRFIASIEASPWMPLLFVSLFAATVLWLQFRPSPRWSLWITFALLALPMLGYVWVCMRVGSSTLVFMK